MHFYALPCTFIHFHALPYTSMHFHTFTCTYMHLHALPCTSMHFHALSCTSIHFHTLPCTSVHFHALPCTYSSMHLLAGTANKKQAWRMCHICYSHHNGWLVYVEPLCTEETEPHSHTYTETPAGFQPADIHTEPETDRYDLPDSQALSLNSLAAIVFFTRLFGRDKHGHKKSASCSARHNHRTTIVRI